MDIRRDKERVGNVATRQHGRIAAAQLRTIGVGSKAISRWIDDGYLTRVLPKVYAVGHLAPGRIPDLWAAILYAGPGAMLSHTTGAAWRGLVEYFPRVIEVSTPRKIDSLPGVRVYSRRKDVDRRLHKALPVTSIAQTMLDLAATTNNPNLVRTALANLDYLQILDVSALNAICGRGRPGTTVLQQAIANHQPQLARVNGKLELNFFLWCERQKLPLPRANVWVHDVLVDAYWPEANLVVELDGGDNHSSRAQIRRDRSNELVLRAHGLRVARYDWDLVLHQPKRVREDLAAQLSVGGPLATNVATRSD